MKKIYTDEQIVGFVREAERTEVTIAEFCRQKGFNEGTFYKWKKRFGSMQVAEVKRLRELAQRGFPQFLRSDNGSEFIAEIIKEFLAENNVKAACIEPGNPWQNGKGESFNGKFRDECLRMEIFGNWREAEVVAEKWRKFYNGERPHSSLGYQTPDEFKQDWEKRQRLLKCESREKLASLLAQGLVAWQYRQI